MPRSPEQARVIGRIGAHELHAQGRTNTGPAREAFLAKFEQEVDPEGVLDPAERERRALHARKAYMQRLALKSAKARRTPKAVA